MPLDNWSFRSRGWFCEWMIDPSANTLQYITVDYVIHMVSRYGAGVLMAKFNVEVTFQNVAFHPSEHHRDAVAWSMVGPSCFPLRSAFSFLHLRSHYLSHEVDSTQQLCRLGLTKLSG